VAIKVLQLQKVRCFFAKGEYNPYTVDGARLIAHEFRHVAQYYEYGEVSFKALYLKQVAQFGYDNAPFEIQAYQFSEALFPPLSQ